jgi:Uma2 family endonuclease
MNAPAVPKVKMRVPEFLAWAEKQPQGRFELVDGQIVAMAPERARHNLAKLEAVVALREAVRAAKLPCTVFTDGVAIVIDEHTTREPDASVQCGIELDLNSMVLQAPTIVVEVVSPSSERDDTGLKLVEYFSVASIRHYLIIYPEKHVVVHHRREARASIATRVANSGESITFEPPGFSVAVTALLGPLPPQAAEAHS